MDLEQALRQFDRSEVNLNRLAAVNGEISELVPTGISFSGSTDEGRRHAELCREFAELADALPAVGGFRFSAKPQALDDIAQARLDASEVGDPEMVVAVERSIDEPALEIDEYRFRFARARRGLVRDRLRELVREVDSLLTPLEPAPEFQGQSSKQWAEAISDWADAFDWEPLATRITEIRRLLEGGSFSGARWSDLPRHLSFAEPVDLRDILMFDWPSVRTDIEGQLYSEREAVPVEVDDLAALAATNPEGAVTTALDWGQLDDEGFERLIFNLFSTAEGYENPQWLTKTRATDRGRDLSAERVTGDMLSGTRRERVMVQCRHRPTQSVSPTDASEAVTKAQLWKDPAFDVVVIATSGRFTTDAIDWIESNNVNNRIRVEMWPESHLEMLLADRPELVQEFRLRP
jgi:hypothetical protein